MKKIIIVLTSIAAVLLMISSATAVPQINSETVIKEINSIEEQKNILNEKINILKNNIKWRPGDFIKKIIRLVIKVILYAIAYVLSGISTIVGLVGVVLTGGKTEEPTRLLAKIIWYIGAGVIIIALLLYEIAYIICALADSIDV